MDQFEAARLKHAKNLERRLRTANKEPEVALEAIDTGGCAPPILVPKENLSDAVIEVTVSLPKGSFSLRFVKADVMSNVPMHKVTKGSISNGIQEGLRPIFGTVVEK